MSARGHARTEESGWQLLLLAGLGATAILTMVVGGVWFARANLGAMDLYRQRVAVEQNPTDAAAVRRLAWTLLDWDSVAPASALAARAVELEPDSADSQLLLGVVLERQDRYKEAVAPLQEALREAPDNALAQFHLAAAYDWEGMWDESEAHARRAVELDPGHARSHGVLARALRFHYDFEEAEREARMGLELSPDDTYLLGVLAEVLQNTGRPGEAIEAYARQAELFPDAARPWVAIGLLEHGRANYPAAVAALEKARELDPEWFGSLDYEQGVLEASREGHQFQR